MVSRIIGCSRNGSWFLKYGYEVFVPVISIGLSVRSDSITIDRKLLGLSNESILGLGWKFLLNFWTIKYIKLIET